MAHGGGRDDDHHAHSLGEGHSIFWKNTAVATGSALANLFSETLVYPFDTINTWIKLSKRGEPMWGVVKSHLGKSGFSSLYKGMNTQLLVAFVPSFLYFLCYEVTNRWARIALDHFSLHSLSTFIPTLTATVSELFSLTVLVPMDAIKTRYQMNSEAFKYNSLSHAFKDIIEKEGLLRLFQASPLYLVNSVVFNTLLFQFYEYFRIQQMKKEHKENTQLTLLDSLRHSLFATMIATSITNPLDLIITRYQCIDSSVGQLSLKNMVKEIVRTEGWLALNRGMTFKTFYWCIDACIYLPIYEQLRKNFGTDFAKSTD